MNGFPILCGPADSVFASIHDVTRIVGKGRRLDRDLTFPARAKRYLAPDRQNNTLKAALHRPMPRSGGSIEPRLGPTTISFCMGTFLWIAAEVVDSCVWSGFGGAEALGEVPL